jgi:ABC-2 type transport system permease protein
MKSTIRLILALIFVGVISISAVLLSRKSVGLQVDLTDNSLYTLSDGTLRILGKLNQPITLKLYYSRMAALKGPDSIRYWNNRYLYVRDLLEEYVRLSGGKIKLELIDPRTHSDEEHEARDNGIRRFPISDDANFYFGMLATTERGKSEVVAFFDSNREELVEYDVSKTIAALMQDKKRKIGVVSSLPVLGSGNMSPYMMQMMRMQGKRPDPPWIIFRQLQMDYEIQNLKLDTHKVPDDIDILMVIHPKKLEHKAVFAIDQFVMKGGKLMVFIDPHCVADQPPKPNPMNRGAPPQHTSASNLNGFLVKWGRVMISTLIAVDPAISTKIPMPDRMGQAGPPESYDPFLTLNKECVNKSEVIVANLNGIQMVFPGAIGGHGSQAGIEYRPLLSTTKTGSLWRFDQDILKRSPADIQAAIRSGMEEGQEPVILAELMTGEIESRFPDGIDIDDDRPDTQPATSQPKPKTRHIDAIAKSSKDAMVIVVADVDILADFLTYPRSNFGMSQSVGNVPFVLNSLEMLSGSNDLISIRSRGRFSRPFTVVDEMEQKTDRDTKKEADRINKEIATYQENLNALLSKRTSEQDMALLDAKLLGSRREIEDKIVVAKRELRKLKSTRRDDIEALERELQYSNVLAAPMILLVIAVILWLVRYFRAKHYAARRA